MTTKLYAIHDSKGVRVSDACFDEVDAWKSALRRDKYTWESWDEFMSFKTDEHGYLCLPVVVSNPKTEVSIPRAAYDSLANTFRSLIDRHGNSARYVAGEIEGSDIKQFLEAGNES